MTPQESDLQETNRSSIAAPYSLCTFCMDETKQERPNNGRGARRKTVAALIIAQADSTDMYQECTRTTGLTDRMRHN